MLVDGQTLEGKFGCLATSGGGSVKGDWRIEIDELETMDWNL